MRNILLILAVLAGLYMPVACQYVQDMSPDRVEVQADTFLPTSVDICDYMLENSTDERVPTQVPGLRSMLLNPEASVRVSSLRPFVVWVIPGYVGLIQEDASLTPNAKGLRILAATALLESIEVILDPPTPSL